MWKLDIVQKQWWSHRPHKMSEFNFMQDILCCWLFYSDTVVMYDAKLISHIVTLSIILLTSIVFVPLLLQRKYRVSSQFWKTWLMRIVLVKVICNATYLTIIVIRFLSKGKAFEHFIDTVRCFAFALAVIAEVCDVFLSLNVNWDNNDRFRISGSCLDISDAFRNYNMQYEVSSQL